MTLRFLDLFSGAGGAAMGLHRAFPDAEIVGVDIKPQPRYPFEHVVADAMTYPLDGFDFIWASPPCQGYSAMRHLPWLKDKDYPMLLEPTIERLTAGDAPWLVENVERARSAFNRAGCYHGWLCGTMFGRRFYRHRIFGACPLCGSSRATRHTAL